MCLTFSLEIITDLQKCSLNFPFIYLFGISIDSWRPILSWSFYYHHSFWCSNCPKLSQIWIVGAPSKWPCVLLTRLHHPSSTSLLAGKRFYTQFPTCGRRFLHSTTWVSCDSTQYWHCLPGDNHQIPQVRAQPHKTAHSHLPLQMPVAGPGYLLCFWLAIDWRFRGPPLWVRLICWNGSQNSEKHFPY